MYASVLSCCSRVETTLESPDHQCGHGIRSLPHVHQFEVQCNLLSDSLEVQQMVTIHSPSHSEPMQSSHLRLKLLHDPSYLSSDTRAMIRNCPTPTSIVRQSVGQSTGSVGEVLATVVGGMIGKEMIDEPVGWWVIVVENEVDARAT